MIPKRRIKPCLKLLLIKKKISLYLLLIVYKKCSCNIVRSFFPHTIVKEESHEIIYLLIYFY